MKHRILVAAFLVVAFASIAAADAEARRFRLAGHGELELPVPTTWKVAVRSPPGDLPPTLHFSAVDGQPFEFMVTPLWAIQGHVPPSDPETLRAQLEHAVKQAQSQAVESQIEVKKLTGASAQGFYFAATDRAPNPGEYKYMTQGILPVGDLVVTFTVLTNDGQKAIVEAALQALRRAVHVPAGTA